MAKQYIVIGGVATGMSAATRLRRLDENAKITVFERGPHVSYANCGLPYYIGGIIKERNRLFLQTPQRLNKRFNINVHVMHEAVSIDTEAKKVEVRDLVNGISTMHSYDNLVLSPGAEPIIPSIPGIDHPSIFSLWNVEDTDRLKSFIEANNPASAIIIGGGFIGLEMVENFRNLGIKVTLVELLPQVLGNFDFEMAAQIQMRLVEEGVNLQLNDPVTSFADENSSVTVTLKSGAKISGSMVLLSIGVRPRTFLAKQAGLSVGTKGGFLVNQFLQTSDPYIYAGGDAIEVLNPLTNKPAFIPLAGPANKHGRLIADNIVLGNKFPYRGTIGTSVVKIFDMTAASTGLSEKQCAVENIAFSSAIIHSVSHAGYYPESQPLTLKLVFNPENSKILGAQAVGTGGVEKRIDIIATAIHGGMTISDLTQIEHAYAPPYSSAKDPVNMVGYLAQNISIGLVSTISWSDLDNSVNGQTVLLDVRTESEVQHGSLPGALNIPIDSLRERIHEIPQGKKIIVFCQAGLRGYVATRILKQRGFNDIQNLNGGLDTYMPAIRARQWQ